MFMDFQRVFITSEYCQR